MKRDIVISIGIILFATIMYGVTLRGAPGNPTVNQFKNNLDQPTKAFELSPERGRYVHIANLAEFGTFNLTKEWAAVAYPDVGQSKDGRYYSFFAPGVAYAALPFYLFGAKYGLAQVGAFSVESIVSIVTLITIYFIGIRIFMLPRWAALFAVLIFGFGSTSWSYAITLYQNAFTTCFAVTGFYAAWKFGQTRGIRAWVYVAYVWLAYGLSIWVDYPNALMMLPVMLYLAYLTFSVSEKEEGIEVSIRWASVFAVAAFVLITGLQLMHNAHYYGAATKLAGGLKNYNPNQAVATSTKLFAFRISSTTVAGLPTPTTDEQEKSVVGFFHEWHMPQSFYVLTVSDERGLLYFSPIFLLSLFGIVYIWVQNKKDIGIYAVPLGLIAFNLFLYSSWGDPWGGWAFGPRYLIPSMPWLALFAALFVASFKTLRSAIIFRVVAFLLFAYSCAVSLLGALTTNAVPPKSEGLLLPAKAYNYYFNIPFLKDGKSSSFVYTTYLAAHISLVSLYILLLSSILLTSIILLAISSIHATEE